MSGLCRLGLWLLLAAGCAAPAAAQLVMLAPSEALACMTPPAAERGLPEYPLEQFERKEQGTVRVELVFDRPDAAPATRVLDDTFTGLIDAVLQHVRKLRVPCQPAGAEPARVVMEFVFRATDGRRVAELPAVDQADAERRRQMACLTRIVPGAKPEYPIRARRDGLQGRFLVELLFADPTAAPAAKFLAGAPTGVLRDSIEAFLPGYRLPCLRGAPLKMHLVYAFQIDGGERTLIRNLQLTQLLGAAEAMPLPASFDFNTMGCPFDVRIDYFQPFLKNWARSLAEARPERSAFLAWLGELRLRLNEHQQREVVGQDFVVSVPCAKLNL